MRRVLFSGCLFILLAWSTPVYAQAQMATGVNLITTAAVLIIILFVIAAIVYRAFSVSNRRSQQVEKRLSELQTALNQMQERMESALAQQRRDDSAYQEVLEQLQARETEIEKLLNSQQHEIANTILALALLPLGEQQYRSKDLKGALDTYQRALELSPRNPAIYYRIGYIYSQRGELNTAEQHLNEALNLDPAFAPALAALGYVYRRRAEKEVRGKARETYSLQAENKLLSALYNSPKLVNEDGESWWCTLGGMYRDRGQYKKAVDAYRKASQITPYSSYPLVHLALYQGMDEDYEGMRQTFREAERLARAKTISNPEDYWFYADLLVTRLALGKIQEAEEALNNVLRMMPAEMAYAGPQLIALLERLITIMPDGAAHIEGVVQHLREHLEQRAPVKKDAVLTNQSYIIPMSDGLPAMGVRVSIQDNLAEVAQTIDLTEPRPAIFVLGGAMDMASQEMQDTRPVIEEGLIPYAQAHNVAIIDGGTHSGVMRLMGEARTKSRATFPLIGVAPVNLVKYPGHDSPEGYDLDPGHSHFIFTQEGEWGDETDTMVQFAYTLTGQGRYPGLGLVINGGAIVRQETYRLMVTDRLKMPVLVLEGSGRFADTLAQALRTGETNDDELREIIAKDGIELVSVKDGAQALQRKLEEYLHPAAPAG